MSFITSFDFFFLFNSIVLPFFVRKLFFKFARFYLFLFVLFVHLFVKMSGFKPEYVPMFSHTHYNDHYIRLPMNKNNHDTAR